MLIRRVTEALNRNASSGRPRHNLVFQRRNSGLTTLPAGVTFGLLNVAFDGASLSAEASSR